MAERREPKKGPKRGDDLVARLFTVSIDAAAVIVIGLFFAVVLFAILFSVSSAGDRLAAWLELEGGVRAGPLLAILGWFALAQGLHYGLGWRGYRSSLGMRMNRVVLQHARGSGRRPRAPGLRYLAEVVLPGVVVVDLLVVIVYVAI